MMLKLSVRRKLITSIVFVPSLHSNVYTILNNGSVVITNGQVDVRVRVGIKFSIVTHIVGKSLKYPFRDIFGLLQT